MSDVLQMLGLVGCVLAGVWFAVLVHHMAWPKRPTAEPRESAGGVAAMVAEMRRQQLRQRKRRYSSSADESVRSRESADRAKADKS